jgi:ABC-type nickel/cobalt efflux system permease component RcnA
MAGRSTQAAAQLVGVLLVIGLVLLILKWMLITAAILVVPFGMWWVWDHGRSRRSAKAVQDRESAAQRRRAELESRAAVDAAGGCGWCGSRVAHWDRRGALVSPLDHHRPEIEDLLRAESAMTHRRGSGLP